ncbi:hypothetical protein ACFLQ5_01945 [Bacteroidota bacterium]
MVEILKVLEKVEIKMEKVPLFEEKDGETIINLCSTAASDDWIRAARLKKAGKLDELKKMEDTPMWRDDDE